MKSLIDQLPTLIGVLVGVVGAIASSTVNDRMRWRREQTVRWDQRRLESYLAFATTLKEIHNLAFRLSAVHRPGAVTAHPVDRQTTLELLAAADIRKTQDWESLLLLGDPATVTAARRWRDAVAQVERLTRADTWAPEAWEPAVHEVDRARDAFHAAARGSLHVPGGSVEQFEHLRSRPQ